MCCRAFVARFQRRVCSLSATIRPIGCENRRATTSEVSGFVPDVVPYLARGTVFVCPLRIGAGLKNKVLEALALGIPVVATPLSVDGIDVRDGESAVMAPVDQIAQKTIELLGDASLRDRLSKNGRELIESRYSWSQTADRYERLYDEICRAK